MNEIVICHACGETLLLESAVPFYGNFIHKECMQEILQTQKEGPLIFPIGDPSIGQPCNPVTL